MSKSAGHESTDLLALSSFRGYIRASSVDEMPDSGPHFADASDPTFCVSIYINKMQKLGSVYIYTKCKSWGQTIRYSTRNASDATGDDPQGIAEAPIDPRQQSGC